LFGVVEIARPNGCRLGVGVFQNIGGIAFMHINRLLGRLLRAFVAPFGSGAVGGDNREHGGKEEGKLTASLLYFGLRCIAIMACRTFKISERSLGGDAYSLFDGRYVSPAFLYSDFESN